MRKSHIKYIAPVIVLILAAGYLLTRQDISVESILAFTPDHPAGAAVIVLLLYALKSVTIFIPLIVLEIAVGHLFPMWTALVLNLTGIVIDLTIPYWIGRSAGMNAIQKLTQKYPRFGEIIGKQQDNEGVLCFFLRIISCLPGDLVTMYMGATYTSFWKNLLGGTLGIFPGMILATVMGGSIREPGSPAFWVSAALTVALSVLSALLYRVYRSKSKKDLHNEA